MSDTNSNFKGRIKVIGFDLDQTLYPKSPEIDRAIQKYIIERIAERRSVPLDAADALFQELYKGGAGLSGRKSLIALGFSATEADSIVQSAVERSDIESILSPSAGVTKLLRELRQRYHLDIVTGSPRLNALRKLARLEIPADLFCHIITADEGSKSDSTAFDLWLASHPEFNASEFLYVGDRPATDYEIPKSMGMQCALVNVQWDERYECPQFGTLLEIRNLVT